MTSTFAPDRSQTATADAHHAQYPATPRPAPPPAHCGGAPVRRPVLLQRRGRLPRAKPTFPAATRPETSPHRYRRPPAKNPQPPPAGNENTMRKIMATHDGDGSSGKRAR